MPPKLNIVFPSASDDLVHRIRNFAEDLQRALASERAGQVENMDTAVTSVVVAVGSTRMLGRATDLIKKALRRNKFSSGVVIERQR